MVVPEVNKDMLSELEAMGFSTARATRALHYSGNIKVSFNGYLFFFKDMTVIYL
jgi:uncharacterized UBP type Zn finger protein